MFSKYVTLENYSNQKQKNYNKLYHSLMSSHVLTLQYINSLRLDYYVS